MTVIRREIRNAVSVPYLYFSIHYACYSLLAYPAFLGVTLRPSISLISA
ncbi:hypothetical protein H206_05509 [Candidatus Electrothrix aarhusensis]|uniref:Uncharacterized protein n=1 Tax=Candidatus Electrothrix aarhusensis TaxID=1859131 RepID=A0A444J4A0_9BACT|nr:hypothetical protein H206_05509 [Candidatus Electrothrix aarhusensis]